jgi:hypothetical protein
VLRLSSPTSGFTAPAATMATLFSALLCANVPSAMMASKRKELPPLYKISTSLGKAPASVMAFLFSMLNAKLPASYSRTARY